MTTPPPDPPGPDEGGDPACWLHLSDGEPAGDEHPDPGDDPDAGDDDDPDRGADPA